MPRAWSGGDDDVDIANPNNGAGESPGTGSGNTDSGFTVNGNTYTINLTHSNFSNPPSNMGTGLSNVGGWMNGKSLGIPALFLRTSDTNIQVYNNVCPYHGRDNEWVLENANTFRCNHQQNRFSTNCDDSSSLACYTSTLSGNTLEVTIS